MPSPLRAAAMAAAVKGGNRVTVSCSSSVEHAAGAEHQQNAELRVDRDADEDFRDAVGHHLLDEESARDPRQPLRRRGRVRGDVRTSRITPPTSDLCSRLRRRP